MSLIRSPRLVSLTALALVAAASAVTQPARAADPTKEQCIDANGTAQELRREGKLSAASDQLRVCENPSCPAPVRDDCTRRLDDLDRVQPTVVFQAKDGTGRDLSAVRVTIDGKPLVERLSGTAIALDPGRHTFSFEVAGQRPVIQEFVISEGEKGRREQIVLPIVESRARQEASGQTESTSPSVIISSTPRTTRRTIGYISGGVGVALLGLTAYYAVTATSRDHDSKTAADSQSATVRATSSAIFNQAQQAQTYAYVSGGIALAAIATGLVLVLTSGAPHKASAVRFTPMIGPFGTGVDVAGAW